MWVNNKMKTNCIRCEKEFENNSHPAAHFFTICKGCREIAPESISDQQMFNLKSCFGGLQILANAHAEPIIKHEEKYDETHSENAIPSVNRDERNN